MLCLFIVSVCAGPSCAHPLVSKVEGYKLGELPGIDALDFIDGGTLDLKGFQGKKTAVFFFWSRYFDKSDVSLSFAARLFKELNKAEYYVLGVSLDSDGKRARAELARNGIDVPMTYNPFLTFPSKLLGTIADNSASLVVLDKAGAVAFLWTLATEDDFNQAQKFFNVREARPQTAGAGMNAK